MNTTPKLPADVHVGDTVLIDHKTTMVVDRIDVSGVAGSTVTLRGLASNGHRMRLVSGRCIRVSVVL